MHKRIRNGELDVVRKNVLSSVQVFMVAPIPKPTMAFSLCLFSTSVINLKPSNAIRFQVELLNRVATITKRVPFAINFNFKNFIEVTSQVGLNCPIQIQSLALDGILIADHK